jgi:hypothetical protein
MPQPNIPGILRQYYTPDRPLTPPPKLPEAYETFSDTFSYGPVQEPAVKPAEPKHPPSGDNPVSSEDITLICRVWDVEDIKTLVSKRVYYIAGDMRREELDELWVHDAEAQKSSSFGRNWGWYTGMEEIRRYYVDAHEAFLRTQMRENHAAAENIGNLYAHPATTGLVELAGDGKTARGLWYAIAQETISRPDGTAEARWMLEKIAIDFLKEEDGWKIWHLMIAADLSCLAGEDYSKQPVYPDPETNPIRLEFGKPSVEALIHDSTFNWWDDYPPIPKPYESFSGSMGYGPEGYRNPAIKGFGAGEGRNYH